MGVLLLTALLSVGVAAQSSDSASPATQTSD
eukprot:SAG31_NODE_32538_length_354_cov_1.215686_1_plen_30_part_10